MSAADFALSTVHLVQPVQQTPKPVQTPKKGATSVSKPKAQQDTKVSAVEFTKRFMAAAKQQATNEGKQEYRFLHMMYAKVGKQNFMQSFDAYYGTSVDERKAAVEEMVEQGHFVRFGVKLYLPEDVKPKNNTDTKQADIKATLAKLGL